MDKTPLTPRQIRARDIIQVNLLRPDVLDMLRQASDPDFDRYKRNGVMQEVAEICVRAMSGQDRSS